MPRFASSAGLLAVVTLAAGAGPAIGAEPPAWQPMLGDLPKAEKAGFGGLCGVLVDHATGEVVINLSDRGFYHSTDGAKTFRRLTDPPPMGRTETPGRFLRDPTGKTGTLLATLVYGAPGGTSPDGGATWTPMDGKSVYADWCAVDWTDPDRKFVLALKHESGGLLIASRDGAGRSPRSEGVRPRLGVRFHDRCGGRGEDPRPAQPGRGADPRRR
jgi:hypothetical protein